MAGQQAPHTFKEVDGFRDWKYFFQFIGEKYADVSLAIVQKDQKMARETMRELIDNSSPYHANTFMVTIKPLDDDYQQGKNDAKYFKELEYPEYYELLVDALDKAANTGGRPTMAPHEKDNLAIAKDMFMKETRALRRRIMQDLSVSGIIPQAKSNKLKRSQRESDPDKKQYLEDLEEGGLSR